MTEDSVTPTTLGDALPREMARVRDEVMPQYLALDGLPGVNVGPALLMMRMELDAAAKALAEGDVIAMLHSYKSLKEFNE